MVGTCTAKLVLLGDSGVGKSSVALRFVQNVFSTDQPSTIGSCFLTKRVPVTDDWTVKLDIWDTAGQERFRSLAPIYYRGASVAAVVYDITSTESFEKAKMWVTEVRAQNPQPILFALVGNKKDMESMRAVSTRTAKEYADSIDALFRETSARTNEGVTELFDEILHRLVVLKKQDIATSIVEDRTTALRLHADRNNTCCYA